MMQDSTGELLPASELKQLYCLYCRYASNTRVKFILVVDEVMPKDEEMRLVSLALHATHLKL